MNLKNIPSKGRYGGMGIMRKLREGFTISFALTILLVSIVLLLFKLGKPQVYIYSGLFTPNDVFGLQVAASKKMPRDEFSYKISVVNVYNFSAADYKKRNPTDIVLASDRSAVILTNDPAHFMYEIYKILKMDWFYMELWGRDGSITLLHDKKFLGFL
jgi:hypothetical protein